MARLTLAVRSRARRDRASAAKPGWGGMFHEPHLADEPYAIQVSPKGDVAVVGNQGANSGDIEIINVIDLTGKAPRIVHTLDVGQYVEGLAFSDDGNYVAVTAQNGSSLAPNHP